MIHHTPHPRLANLSGISLLVIACLSLLVLPDHAHPQISLDGTMGGGKGPLTGPNYDITANLGKRCGANLFHSFDTFNLLKGESATFSGPNGIANIISRVTGRSASTIDGLLKSTIDGANLFLVNPNGIVFGPNASLDISGSFHASTADYLRFADGAKFYANTIETSVLSAAAPAAFGFLSNNPGGISVDRSVLSVLSENASDRTLSLIGGNIDIGNIDISDAGQYIAGNRINIASVASPGEVIPNAPGRVPGLAVEGFEGMGKITMSNGATLKAEGTGGGAVFIRGGQLTMASTGGPQSQILSYTSGDLTVPGRHVGIDVSLTGDLNVSGGYIRSFTTGSCRGGDMLLAVKSLLVSDGGWINAQTQKQSSGRGGDVIIRSRVVKLTGESAIGVASIGEGNAGNIDISEADTLQLLGGSYIDSSTFGSGVGGKIAIQSSLVELTEGSSISAVSKGSGNAGNIDISNADTLHLLRSSYIDSSTEGSGVGGNIAIRSKVVELTGGSLILAASSGSGNAGNINISKADTLQLLDGSHIDSITSGSGVGGKIAIQSKVVELTDGSHISAVSDFFATGKAGKIDISEADTLQLVSGSYIDSRTYGTGFGGNIAIRSRLVELTGGSSILAVSDQYAAGNAGNIVIGGRVVELTGVSYISAGSLGSGNAGNIHISEADTVQLLGRSFIDSSTKGSGDGGSIAIQSRLVELAEGSFISAGSVKEANGNAGNIVISETDTLRLLSGSRINASTIGSGVGGYIKIRSRLVELSGGSGIGAVSGGSGNAGNINMTLDTLQLLSGSEINSSTDGSGMGGNIAIRSRLVELTGGSGIGAVSGGSGNAGNIDISVADTFLSRNSAVTTEARQADGGNISLHAGYMARFIDSDISTSVGGGPQTVGGNLNIDSGYVILQNSRIIANAFEGKGGNIRIIGQAFLADPNSVVDASSSLGINGTVDIRALVQSVSGIVQPLPKDFVSADELLRTPCEARLKGGKAASLIVTGRQGLPAEPGWLLPSPL